jgi:hypothetical protein
MNPSLGNLRCTWPQLFSQSWGLFLFTPLGAMSGIFGACRFQVLDQLRRKSKVTALGISAKTSESLHQKEGKEASPTERSMSLIAAGDLQLA